MPRARRNQNNRAFRARHEARQNRLNLAPREDRRIFRNNYNPYNVTARAVPITTAIARNYGHLIHGLIQPAFASNFTRVRRPRPRALDLALPRRIERGEREGDLITGTPAIATLLTQESLPIAYPI